MFYFLFVFYFFLSGFVLKKHKFFNNSEIPFPILIAIFVLKIIAGIFYSYYFSLPSQITNADTWSYFIESKMETSWLLQNPKTFFADLFTNHYAQSGNLFSGTNSFWNDLKSTFFIKLLAVLNILSFGNYYINLLFFNTFFMFGGVALYKLFKENFIINKLILTIATFLMPGCLFWCSGLHKDGIVFSATAISLYAFYKVLINGLSYKRVIVLLLCLMGIFLLRNYYLLAFFPAFWGWVLVKKYQLNSKFVFGSVITICLLFFIFSSSFNITKVIANSVVTKHHEFLMLEGNTKFETPKLNANSNSILAFFPFALESSLLRPFPNSVKSKGELLAMLENNMVLIFLISAVIAILYKKDRLIESPIILASLTISFFLLLFIGYTVCFDAAIIRYRSVFLPFLIVPCLVIIFGKQKSMILKK